MKNEISCRVTSYRYMWRLKDTPAGTINVKVVAETDAGHKAFVEQISKFPTLLAFAREYICEYDVTKFGAFDVLYGNRDGLTEVPHEG